MSYGEAAGVDPETGHRQQTLGEEIANSVSHGAGAVAALISVPYLLAQAYHAGGTRKFIGAAAFGASAILLYAGSAIYHALPHGRAKRAFRIAEHMAIYFMIAGGFTPFMLGVLHGPVGTALLWTIWALTAAGLMFKVYGGTRFPRASTALYMLMAWTAVLAVGPLWRLMPHSGFYWIIAGAACYNVGVVFFLRDHRWRYGHFVWHVFVLAGTACHFCAVLWYAG